MGHATGPKNTQLHDAVERRADSEGLIGSFYPFRAFAASGRVPAWRRERPVNPERSHRCMAAALEAAQRSFVSAGDRPFGDISWRQLTAAKQSVLQPRRPGTDGRLFRLPVRQIDEE